MKAANVTLKDVMREIQALRREVTLFVPQESTDVYENKREIKQAFARARKQFGQL